MSMKNIVAMAVTWAIAVAMPHADSKVAPPFKVAKGAFFALSVADLPASIQWYSQKLGLEVVMQEPKKPGDKAGFAVLEGGGLVVELVQLDDAVPLNKAVPSADGRQMLHGLFKAGFIVEDFDGAVAALKARGVEIAYGPYPAREGQRANVIVKDNVGNLIQVFGPR
jgi:catechol 2,3-dioxygenase-like lactoylglutathione lyase family enzyme